MKKKHRILHLKPTQLAIGLEEIEAKVETLLNMSKKKRLAHIHDHPITVVRARSGSLYVVDHHHFLYALWILGFAKVPIKIIDDLSKYKLNHAAFWKMMVRKKYAHLYDQFGKGPHAAVYLPRDIRGMADDPYRSLAWECLRRGAFEPSTKYFYQFEWAQFLRRQKILHVGGREGFERAIKKAVPLCKSRRARKLPGYVGAK